MANGKSTKNRAPVIPITRFRSAAALNTAAEPVSISQNEIETAAMLRRMLRIQRRQYDALCSSIRSKLQDGCDVEVGDRYCSLERYESNGRELIRLVID